MGVIDLTANGRLLNAPWLAWLDGGRWTADEADDRGGSSGVRNLGSRLGRDVKLGHLKRSGWAGFQRPANECETSPLSERCADVGPKKALVILCAKPRLP